MVVLRNEKAKDDEDFVLGKVYSPSGSADEIQDLLLFERALHGRIVKGYAIARPYPKYLKNVPKKPLDIIPLYLPHLLHYPLKTEYLQNYYHNK